MQGLYNCLFAEVGVYKRNILWEKVRKHAIDQYNKENTKKKSKKPRSRPHYRQKK